MQASLDEHFPITAASIGQAFEAEGWWRYEFNHSDPLNQPVAQQLAIGSETANRRYMTVDNRDGVGASLLPPPEAAARCCCGGRSVGRLFLSGLSIL